LGKASLNDFIASGSRHVLLEAAANYQPECDSEQVETRDGCDSDYVRLAGSMWGHTFKGREPAGLDLVVTSGRNGIFWFKEE
jgi:hypothetical protein